MSNELAVYGAGGHGKVVAEVLAAMGAALVGFIDDNPALQGTAVLKLPVFAAGEWLGLHSGASVALGIGDNSSRERAALALKQQGCKLVIAIHPSAIIAKSAVIGEGAVIMPSAVLNPDCTVGEGAIVNTGAVVEHDVRVGRYAHLSPNCTIGGGAQIGEYSHIGMSASVLPLRRVGANCVIGAGAVVIDDIFDGQIALGVPARIRPQKSDSP